MLPVCPRVSAPTNPQRNRSRRHGQEGWRREAFEVCVDGGAEELKDRAALGFAGADGGPDPFAPALALVSASAPGDASIDDEVTDGLFRHVVGGFDAGGGDEGEELVWQKNLDDVKSP